DGEDRARETGFHGVVLDAPQPRPDFTLRDTGGQPFRFRAETAGTLTLLFFGYTNCPDVCPVHLANLSAVLDRFAYDVRSRVRVVFVTTDPARDSPDKLRAWLDNFDPSFVGLTGTQAEVEAAQRAAGVAVAAIERDGTDDYTVAHASQLIAYSPDDFAYVAYPAGIRQVDWVHDLPRLLEPHGYLEAGGAP
ncbi:MAG: SCO family protein, partial [Longimicrobiales bacterium]